MNMIRKMAPDFQAAAVMANNTIDEAFVFSKYRGNEMAVIFFYPLDFTFVCPSEIIAFHHRMDEFSKRKTKVVGISIDSHFVHLAWKNTPVNNGGIGAIDFPLVADLTKSIAQSYDVLLPEGIALRGTFLIDKAGMVRHQIINDLPLGRNIDETIRMVDALIHHEEHGEVCPAGWHKNKAAMKPSSVGVAEYLAKHEAEL